MTYNAAVVEEAERISQVTIAEVLSQPGVERGIVAQAVAGAGKTHFVVSSVAELRRAGQRVAVCTPTNEQAFALVRRLATRIPNETVTWVPASRITVPADIALLPNVVIANPASTAHGASIIVGTFDKLGDAFSRGDLAPVHTLLADESYQADSTRYYAVAGLAPTHLLVGDPGQLDPFSTVDTNHWRGLAEDPLQTAVGVLRRNHPSTEVYKLPASRRLDPRAVEVARAFYPSHHFDAAVLPEVRQLQLMRSMAQDGRTLTLDKALDLAARAGWAHLELRDDPVLTADPEMVTLITDLVRRLSERDPQVRCELTAGFEALEPRRIAIGVSHNDQKDSLRISLDAAGFRDVVVNTANKLQGAEFDLVVAWHPLTGLPDADGFHLDPGRLCVLLTRHRHACIVVGREGDRSLVDGVPPSTAAHLGWDPDPVLDGWDVHQSVFERLAANRVA